jgi:hypothetical protein
MRGSARLRPRFFAGLFLRNLDPREAGLFGGAIRLGDPLFARTRHAGARREPIGVPSHIFGFGVVVGDAAQPDDVGGFAWGLRRMSSFARLSHDTPPHWQRSLEG